MGPAAPTFMFTALAVNRSRPPCVCACARIDSAAAAPTAAAPAEMRRTSPGIPNLLCRSCSRTAPLRVRADGDEIRASSTGLLARRRREHRFATFAATQIDHLCGLADLQHVERVGVIVDVGDRLTGDFDNHVA